MLRSLNEIMHFQLQGIDEEIGCCKNFLFNDKLWVIAYMVTDTNKWLPGGRKVLISPISFCEPNWEQYQFSINLTREEIKNSSSLDEHRLISHLDEAELFNVNVLEDGTKNKSEDRHLRSIEKAKGHGICAIDQEIGHVEDFILNDQNWTIPYIVIDTSDWFPGGGKLLISHKSIEAVNWAERSVTVKLSAQMVQGSPRFDLKLLMDPEYELQLVKYFENH
tara:strand:- start:431 stop:1093 length:663 start_codon:yes stop_codon:yes gene_type:complete